MADTISRKTIETSIEALERQIKRADRDLGLRKREGFDEDSDVIIHLESRKTKLIKAVDDLKGYSFSRREDRRNSREQSAASS